MFGLHASFLGTVRVHSTLGDDMDVEATGGWRRRHGGCWWVILRLIE